jgi:hypothetical protein
MKTVIVKLVKLWQNEQIPDCSVLLISKDKALRHVYRQHFLSDTAITTSLKQLLESASQGLHQKSTQITANASMRGAASVMADRTALVLMPGA